MKDSEFRSVIKKRKEAITQVLEVKSREYMRGEDRLSNFKRAAEALRCTPERALLGFMLKHIVSIIDMVDDVETSFGNYVPSKARWDEKIGDTINYLILLEGLITERIQKMRQK